MVSQLCWLVNFNRCHWAKRQIGPGFALSLVVAGLCAWVVVWSAPWRLHSLFTLSRSPGTLLGVTEQQNMFTVCLTNGPGWKQPGDHLWESNVVMMAGIPARKIQPAWKFQAQGWTTPSLHLTVCQHNTCTEAWIEGCESAYICEQMKDAHLCIIKTLACNLWGPSLFLSCFQCTASNAQSTFWYSLESDANSADNQRDVLKMVNFLFPFVLPF